MKPRLLVAALVALSMAAGCSSAMKEPPETLESLCARDPSAPACRYLTLPPEAR